MFQKEQKNQSDYEITQHEWFAVYYVLSIDITGIDFNEMRQQIINCSTKATIRIKYLTKRNYISIDTKNNSINELEHFDNKYISYVNNKDIEHYLQQCKKRQRITWQRW